MKLGLINSAWAQSGRDTAFGIRMTKEIGFDTIDIFADPLDLDVKERRLIKQECDRVGLPIVSIACVAVGLIDFNPSVQRFHLQRCRAYLDLAYEYQARNLLLVLGEYIWEKQVIPPAEQWQTGARNVRELGRYAADLGLQIALELEPFKLSLVNNVDSMVRFLDEVDHPAVKANIDVSHLQLAKVAPSLLWEGALLLVGRDLLLPDEPPHRDICHEPEPAFPRLPDIAAGSGCFRCVAIASPVG